MSSTTTNFKLTKPAMTDTFQALVDGIVSSMDILDAMFPVGTYYVSDNSSDPNAFRPGTWTQITDGRVIAACSTAHPAGTTTGSETHTLTIDEMPEHTHPQAKPNTLQNTATGSSTYGFIGDGSYGNTGAAGGGRAHSIMQPTRYVYAWKRIA